MNEEELAAFKEEYEKNGKYDLQCQIPHLARLADGYVEKYKQTNNWADCVKAHALYNSVAARERANNLWPKKAFDIQRLFWKQSSSITFEEHDEVMKRLREQLHSIRNTVRQQLKDSAACASVMGAAGVDRNSVKTDFIDYVSATSVHCTNEMISLAEQVMVTSLNMTKEKPPCPFQVVAIGSLARGEATPYSDLEYMFLLAEKSPEIEEFFEKLAITTYFVMGNFRETKLSYMAIDELRGWFEDKSKNGFKIDGLAPGAGNIPTGNGKSQLKNHFIVTPQEMAERYESILNDPNEKEALRGDLTAMMAYMKPVFTYQGGEDILPQLKRHLLGMKPNEKRQAVNLAMLRNDMVKFNFKPDAHLEVKGYAVDVKKDLYRFPSLLLYDISIVCSQIGESVWETVEQLFDRKIISEHVRTSILFQLACACYMRLSAYLFYDSHDDRISVVSNIHEKQSEVPFCSDIRESRWVVPGEVLLEMCRYMVPLKLDLSRTDDIFQTLQTSQTGSDWFAEAQVLYFSGGMRNALHLLEVQFGVSLLNDHVELVRTLTEQGGFEPAERIFLIADILSACGKHQTATKLYSLTGEKITSCSPLTWKQRFTSSLSAADSFSSFLGSVTEGVVDIGALYESFMAALDEKFDSDLDIDFDSEGAVSQIAVILGQLSTKVFNDTNPMLAHLFKHGIQNISHGMEFVGNKEYRTSLHDFEEGQMLPIIEGFANPSLRKQRELELISKEGTVVDDSNITFGLLESNEKMTRKFPGLSPIERLEYIKSINKVSDYDLFLADLIYKLANVHGSQGKYLIADSYYIYCETVLNEVVGRDSVTQRNAMLNKEMGKNHMHSGRRKSALQRLKQAINIFKQLQGEDSVEIRGVEVMIKELQKDTRTFELLVDDDID